MYSLRLPPHLKCRWNRWLHKTIWSNQTELYFPVLQDSLENTDGFLLPGLCACSCLLLSQGRAEKFLHTIIRQKAYFLHYIQSESKLSPFCVLNIYEKLRSLAKSVSCVSLVSVHLYFSFCIRNVSFFPKAPALAESLCLTNHNYWGIFRQSKMRQRHNFKCLARLLWT